jgi:protein-S-isoprenylcysteine O-methyltransferase Ste14
MGDTSEDPIDHARTTRQHAGESMKNGANAPGLVSMAIAVAAMVIGLTALAAGNSQPGAIAIAAAVVAAVIGGLWLFIAHRRVRRQELLWAAEHPIADDAPPPTS